MSKDHNPAREAVAPITPERLAEVRERFAAIPRSEPDSLTGHVKGMLALIDHLSASPVPAALPEGQDPATVWRDIGSAPEDERILVATSGGWVGEASLADGEWRWSGSGHVLHSNTVPLKWMPLPEHPDALAAPAATGGQPPLNMLVSREQLRDKIARDPDTEEGEARSAPAATGGDPSGLDILDEFVSADRALTDTLARIELVDALIEAVASHAISGAEERPATKEALQEARQRVISGPVVAVATGGEAVGELERLKQQLYIGLGASGRYFTHQECETLHRALARPAPSETGASVGVKAREDIVLSLESIDFVAAHCSSPSARRDIEKMTARIRAALEVRSDG